ncbi:MAG: phospholipid/cholesterol/gamma-HCH transport system permease protein [Candidatus Binatota bacterium]|nr:phospholipid/cholesterol/gamma-HCH transport system permease protein [Candidatus Binatota bacterium]
MSPEPVLLPFPERLDADPRDLRRSVLGQARGSTVVLDLSGVPALDEVAAARLLRLAAEGRAAGIDVRLAGLSEDARRLLADVDPGVLEEDLASPKIRNPLEMIGAGTLDAIDTAASVSTLVKDTAFGVARPFGKKGIRWDRTLEQMALVGADAVPIVVFISFLVGAVLALNGAAQLRQFGAAIFIANLVGISMTREMGPLITAVIVAGRTGSAIAAEIGSMVVSEEIDAMRTMAISPVRFLVVPKVLALALVMPLLTTLSNAAGILGGYLVGIAALQLSSDAYVSQTVQSLFLNDVITGLAKSVVFAVLIGFVGVYKGLSVRGGPEAVGRATTSSVVTSIILCIVANAAFTALFYFTE